VDEWFDGELLDAVARLRPDWRFEIVGAVETTRAATSAPGNVRYRGERPHEELPALRARFDAEIIPFRPSPLTHAVDPVKLYEAAAAGRPVVATPLESLRRFEDAGVVRLARTPEEFVRAIESAVSEPPGEAERRRAFARSNTWDDRSAQLQGWIRELYPLVSIVVVTHGALPLTRLCLESLERRTDWPRTEIVVVDNGSTDATPQWLEAQAARPGSGLRPLLLPENRGFAAGANAGAAAARGEYLCFLNNDTVITRGWLSALVRHLRADAGLGMVGASTNEIANAARVPVGYREPEELESWARRFTADNAGRREELPMLALFCALLPRRVYEEVGPLDERFAVGMFEDDDYCRRLRERGYRLAVARDAFVHHWGRGTFRQLGEDEYLRIYRENERRYRDKWER
jgi:GT2 family glycosyltransferase